jgi:hypothetical protein
LKPTRNIVKKRMAKETIKILKSNKLNLNRDEGIGLQNWSKSSVKSRRIPESNNQSSRTSCPRLGEQNENGELLIEVCGKHGLKIRGTMFSHQKCHMGQPC